MCHNTNIGGDLYLFLLSLAFGILLLVGCPRDGENERVRVGQRTVIYNQTPLVMLTAGATGCLPSESDITYIEEAPLWDYGRSRRILYWHVECQGWSYHCSLVGDEVYCSDVAVPIEE